MLEEKYGLSVYAILLLFSNYALYKILNFLYALLFRYSENEAALCFYNAIFPNDVYEHSTFLVIDTIIFLVSIISVIIYTKILFTKSLKGYSDIFFKSIQNQIVILLLLITCKVLFNLDSLFIPFYCLTLFFAYIRKYVCDTIISKDMAILSIYVLGICSLKNIALWLFKSFTGFFLFICEHLQTVNFDKSEFIDVAFLTCIISAEVLLCSIILFAVSILITKIALDRKWSKYLNYIYDHFIYFTLMFAVLIFYLVHFNIDGVIFSLYIFIYIFALIRKFFKPLYNNILLLLVIFCLWFYLVWLIK